jgi:CHAT domain-containing protein/tetratricopeptide (TPR) repeat protein
LKEKMKSTVILFFLLIGLIPVRLLAQYDDYSIEELEQKVDQLASSGKLKEALPFMEQLVERAAAKEEKDTIYGEYLMRLSVLYYSMGSYESSVEYMTIAKDFWAEKFGRSHAMYMACLSNLGAIYDVLGRIDESEKLLFEVLNTLEKHHPDKQKDLALVANNLGALYENTGRYQEAETYYQQAIDIRRTLTDTISMGYYAASLNNMANLYALMKRYTAAEQLYLEAIEKTEALFGDEHFEYAATLNNLAVFYFRIKAYKKAIPLYEKVLDIRKTTFGVENADYATSLFNLGDVYNALEDYSKALEYQEEAAQLLKQTLGANHLRYLAKSVNLCKTYEGLGQEENARSLYKILKENWQKIGQENNPLFSDLINNYADFERKNGDTTTAMKLLREALFLNIGSEAFDFQKAETYNYRLPLRAVRSLQIIASILSEQAPKKAFSILKQAANINFSARQQFQQKGDQLNVLASNSKVVEQSLDLGTKEHTASTNAMLFELVEMNKSVLLADVLQATQNKQLGNLADSIAQKRSALQIELAQLKKSLLTTNATEKTSALRVKYNGVIQQMNELQEEIKQKYPKYYNAQFDRSSVDISSIQRKLSKETALISYFVGEKQSYVFLITRDSSILQPIPLSRKRFNDQLKKLRQSLSDYKYIIKEKKRAKADYIKSAHWFYKHFIPSYIAEQQRIKKLIIIPDDGLGHLPFEVFLTKDVEDQLKYNEMPYLMHSYEISYHYSCKLWKQKQAEGKTKALKLSAFAASYGQEGGEQLRSQRAVHLRNLRDALSDLPAAQAEVKALNDRFKGQFYYGEAASESNFKETIKEASVIHLAMHGLLNVNHPMLSSLAFSEDGDSLEDNFLQAWEIAQLNLEAKLVVLSACETGFGKFQQGEGVMSLARSFMYAGVPSLVVSLWQVNDASTSVIMQNFYQHLAKGENKAEALRNAKLAYLTSAEDLAAHPAFWSPYILIGDERPVKLQRKGGVNWLWWAVGAGALALAALGFGLARRKRAA